MTDNSTGSEAKPGDRLDELLAEMPPNSAARMPFADRCAAYGLLKRRFKQNLVAKVFGVSEPTIGRLARAGEDAAYYASVVREFNRLGHDEFIRTYVTEDIIDRLQRFRFSVPTSAPRLGPNQLADKHAGQHQTEAYDGMPITLTVFWIADEGWTYRQDEPVKGSFIARERYRTSTLAWVAAIKGYTGENPLRGQ